MAGVDVASLEAPWQTTTVVGLRDYQHQRFDLVTLRQGAWPRTGGVAVEWDQAAPYGIPTVGGTIYFEVNHRPKPVIFGVPGSDHSSPGFRHFVFSAITRSSSSRSRGRMRS